MMTDTERTEKLKSVKTAASLAAVNPLLPASIRVLAATVIELLADFHERLKALETR